MIVDRINNSHLYSALNPGIKRAFEYIQQADPSNIAAGRYEVDGENLYVMVQQYNTKPMEAGVWEAHRRYIDLQYVIQGAEKIGYANLSRLTQGEYDANRDFLPLFGEGEFLTLKSGDFVILMPEDAHMPGLAVDALAPVKKMVLKILVA
ncbi:MAG: YhcH/YjgK/YiaL family protein [Chloroflexi bacterium HGW-Chloroflexi-6]|nr:MAG: YhcH/YjgK/YiaL family protein [Chloroflexi bacterium HGW-Chloroflexi-6]